MSDNELWSAIIGVLAAVIVRVLDYYFPGIGHVTEKRSSTTADEPTVEGRHRGDSQASTDDSSSDG